MKDQLTPLYSPQCNSTETERIKRVIKPMKKQCVRDDHRAWDENLIELQFQMQLTSNYEAT